MVVPSGRKERYLLSHKMVAPRRRNHDKLERSKRLRRYLVVAAVCSVAVYMLMDVEDMVENESRNPAETQEVKTNPNQLRGMPDNRYNSNINNNMDPNMPISGGGTSQLISGMENPFGDRDVNQYEHNFESNNNFDKSKPPAFPTGNEMNHFGSENDDLPIRSQDYRQDQHIGAENMERPLNLNMNNEQPLDDVNGSLEEENFIEDVKNTTEKKTEDTWAEENELLNVDEHHAENTLNHGENSSDPSELQVEDHTLQEELDKKEKLMIETATNDEANQDLNTAIIDVKMDIEEVEEELVVKEEDHLKDPLKKAVNENNEVIENMLNDNKYAMSKDALDKMEKEVEERLENEVNDELSKRAEIIAEEKQEEIDVVVIEDRNMYPNTADIEKDMKRMERFFIQDMEKEISETADNIKENIPQRVENITMEVVEEKTGLHIKEDYLKSTEKKITEKNEKRKEKTASEKSKSVEIRSKTKSDKKESVPKRKNDKDTVDEGNPAKTSDINKGKNNKPQASHVEDEAEEQLEKALKNNETSKTDRKEKGKVTETDGDNDEKSVRRKLESLKRV